MYWTFAHPLFSLRIHRRVLGCGYHSNNDGVFCFFPTFHMAVDDEVDTYVSFRCIGLKKTKVFKYIQPCASAESATDGSVPRCSNRLNPPPPTPTPSLTPTTALTEIPEPEEEWDYDYDVELDVDVTEATVKSPPSTNNTPNINSKQLESIWTLSFS